MGHVEFFDLCETIPKLQCSECLLYWNQGVNCCICGHFLVESESSQIFHQWRLDALSIPHCVIKKRTTPWCSARQNWSTERAFRGPHAVDIGFWWNSRSFPTSIVIRNFKLAGWRRNASRWTSWHKKTTPTVKTKRNLRDIKDSGISHWTNRARKRRCDFDQTSSCSHNQEPSPSRISEERAEPISHQQYRRWHPSSSSDSWWNWDTSKSWWSSWEINSFFLKKFVGVGFVYSCWQSTVTDGECRQHTSHVIFFCAQCACWTMCCTTHWLKCLHERVISSAWSSMSCVWFVLSVYHLVPFRVFPELNCFHHVVHIRAI